MYRFGEFTFDSGSRLLQRDGETQRLSPKAQQLLMMLLENRPKVVTREQIYDALWPSTFVCETNMASIVSELRRALGDDARSGQYVRTVHGFGYAFSGDVRTEAPEPQAAAILLCEGMRHSLFEGENSVGRSKDCAVLLNDPMVSRHHAVIILSGKTIFIEDRGSRNGTYVCDRKITRTQVRYNDPIRFGVVSATIVRKISSTIPTPLIPGTPRRQSSDSFTTA